MTPKKILFILALLTSAFSLGAQTSAQYEKITARVWYKLRNREVDSFTVVINVSSTHRQLPTAKAVYDFVTSYVTANAVLVADGPDGDITGSWGDLQLLPDVVGETELDETGVVAGEYTNPTVTVDEDGRITEIANGDGGGGAGYDTLRDDGTMLAKRRVANFQDGAHIQFTLTDDASNKETDVGAGIVTNSLGPGQLASTGVEAGEYTNPTLTVDEDGRITEIEDGSTSGLSDGDYGDIDISGSATVFTVDTNAVGSIEVIDNSITAADMSVNVVSSVEGVTNDGGNIDVVPGTGISVSGDDGANTITITNTGDTNASDDLTTSTTFSGDVTGTYNATVVGDNTHNHDATTITTNIVASVDGVSNDGGDIDLVPGSGITITPNDGANTITIAATGGSGNYQTLLEDGSAETQRAAANFIDGSIVTFTLTDDAGNNETEVTAGIVANSIGTGQIATDGVDAAEIVAGAVGTSEVADGSLTAADLSVNVVSSVEGVTNDGGNIDVVPGTGIGVSGDDGANTITITNTGDTNASDDLTTSTTFSGDVTGTYNATVVGDNTHTHDATTITTNIVASVDGVTNDGGDIDLVAGSGITITPNDGANTITIAATGGSGNYQTLLEDGSAETQRAAANFIDGSIVTFTLTDDAGNNETEVTAGIVANSIGTGQIATDGVDAAEIVAGAVGTSEVADGSLTATDLSVNVVASVDGVTNDGGDIDLVAGTGVSITPNDGANTITIASTVTGLPSGTTNQTLHHNGTTWVANSEITNDGSKVGIGASPQAGVELYVNGGPIQVDASLVSYGAGNPTATTDAAALRLWNSTPTTGDLWYFGSENGGSLTIQGATAGSAMTITTSGDVEVENSLSVGSLAGTPTVLIGRDASTGEIGEITLAAGLELDGGELSVTGGGGGGSNYQTLLEDGSAETQRAAANFLDGSIVTFTLTDDAGNNETEVSAGIVANSIGTGQIATDGVDAAEIVAGAVGTSEVADGSLTAADLGVNVVSSVEGVTNDGGNIDVVPGTGIGVSGDDGANTITITNTGDTNASDDLTTSTTFSGDVTGTYNATVVGDNTHTHDATTITTNIVASVDGVTNDGGDIDLVAGSGITITPNDGANTITIAATGGSGNYQTLLEDGSAETQRAAANFIDGSIVTFTLTDDAGNNETEVTAGIVANSIGTGQIATDGVDAAEIAAGAVGTSEVADGTLTATDLSVNVVSSVDGVTNDGGDIDMVAGTGISITPNDGANTITIASTVTGLPSGTANQTLYHNGSAWAATSEITNDGTKVGIGASPQSGVELYVNGGPIQVDASLVSYGAGDPTATTNGAALRLWNSTPTTGDLWYLGSQNNGTFTIQGATAGSALTITTGAQVQTTNSLRIGSVTGTPTSIVGRNGSGDVGSVSIGSGLSLSSGTLSATGSGGAPTDATYVTLTTNATLTNERVLTEGNNVNIVDAGAGSTITIEQGTEAVAWTADISPSALGSDQNNWNPTGWGTSGTGSATDIYVTMSVSAVSITGLAGGGDGRFAIIHNVDATDVLTLLANSASSTGANRFGFPYDVVLDPGEVAVCKYNSIKGSWGLISHTAVANGTKITVFTSSGTWTKSSGVKTVDVICIGGGGGGESGSRAAIGAVRSGGRGGAGGGLSRYLFQASDLGSTVTVTVGAGGAGGAAVSTNSTAGNLGTTGGTTTFGSHLAAIGGSGGGQGAGTARGNIDDGGSGGTANGTGGAGNTPTSSTYAPSGGGGGGGVNTSNSDANGGTGGGVFLLSSLSGGTAGTISGGAGGNGNSESASKIGTGGGGGRGNKNGNGGTGGAGANYGGGGGGGGGNTNDTGNSGAGGAGANGIVIVIENY